MTPRNTYSVTIEICDEGNFVQITEEIKSPYSDRAVSAVLNKYGAQTPEFISVEEIEPSDFSDDEQDEPVAAHNR